MASISITSGDQHHLLQTDTDVGALLAFLSEDADNIVLNGFNEIDHVVLNRSTLAVIQIRYGADVVPPPH